MPGMSGTTPKQAEFKKGGQWGGARKGDSAGDAGKIDEQVGIHEQVGSMRESGESAIFSIQKIKAVLTCYLNEGQCWTDKVYSEYLFILRIDVIIILFPVWARIKHEKLNNQKINIVWFFWLLYLIFYVWNGVWQNVRARNYGKYARVRARIFTKKIW